jgi:hypothetical protein
MRKTHQKPPTDSFKEPYRLSLSPSSRESGTQIQENPVSEPVSSRSSSFFVLAVSLDPRVRGDEEGKVSVFLEQNDQLDNGEFLGGAHSLHLQELSLTEVGLKGGTDRVFRR